MDATRQPVRIGLEAAPVLRTLLFCIALLAGAGLLVVVMRFQFDHGAHQPTA